MSLAAAAKPPRPSFLALEVCEYAGAARCLALMRAGCASARACPGWCCGLVPRVVYAVAHPSGQLQKAHKLIYTRTRSVCAEEGLVLGNHRAAVEC